MDNEFKRAKEVLNELGDSYVSESYTVYGCYPSEISTIESALIQAEKNSEYTERVVADLDKVCKAFQIITVKKVDILAILESNSVEEYNEMRCNRQLAAQDYDTVKKVVNEFVKKD